MNMTEETMNDALDDILAESGDEEEEEGIVNQVLDEIGIEISGKVRLLEAFIVYLVTILEHENIANDNKYLINTGFMF